MCREGRLQEETAPLEVAAGHRPRASPFLVRAPEGRSPDLAHDLPNPNMWVTLKLWDESRDSD